VVEFPILVTSGNGHVKVAWSESEALAFAALFLAEQLHAERMPFAVAEELAAAPLLSASC
jgi:hypothetical protein